MNPSDAAGSAGSGDPPPPLCNPEYRQFNGRRAVGIGGGSKKAPAASPEPSQGGRAWEPTRA
jgi:hypothetical protein